MSYTNIFSNTFNNQPGEPGQPSSHTAGRSSSNNARFSSFSEAGPPPPGIPQGHPSVAGRNSSSSPTPHQGVVPFSGVSSSASPVNGGGSTTNHHQHQPTPNRSPSALDSLYGAMSPTGTGVGLSSGNLGGIYGTTPAGDAPMTIPTYSSNHPSAHAGVNASPIPVSLHGNAAATTPTPLNNMGRSMVESPYLGKLFGGGSGPTPHQSPQAQFAAAASAGLLPSAMSPQPAASQQQPPATSALKVRNASPHNRTSPIRRKTSTGGVGAQRPQSPPTSPRQNKSSMLSYNHSREKLKEQRDREAEAKNRDMGIYTDPNAVLSSTAVATPQAGVFDHSGRSAQKQQKRTPTPGGTPKRAFGTATLHQSTASIGAKYGAPSRSASGSSARPHPTARERASTPSARTPHSSGGSAGKPPFRVNTDKHNAANTLSQPAPPVRPQVEAVATQVREALHTLGQTMSTLNSRLVELTQTQWELQLTGEKIRSEIRSVEGERDEVSVKLNSLCASMGQGLNALMAEAEAKQRQLHAAREENMRLKQRLQLR